MQAIDFIERILRQEHLWKRARTLRQHFESVVAGYLREEPSTAEQRAAIAQSALDVLTAQTRTQSIHSIQPLDRALVAWLEKEPVTTLDDVLLLWCPHAQRSRLANARDRQLTQLGVFTAEQCLLPSDVPVRSGKDQVFIASPFCCTGRVSYRLVSYRPVSYSLVPRSVVCNMSPLHVQHFPSSSAVRIPIVHLSASCVHQRVEPSVECLQC